jgi:hypothetical protein
MARLPKAPTNGAQLEQRENELKERALRQKVIRSRKGT